MPTDDETDDAMDAVEAAVHAQLRAAFAHARQSVPIDDDDEVLVATARQRRSTRHVSDAGTSATSNPAGKPGTRPGSTRPTTHRRSRWITIGVPAAAAVIVIAVISAVVTAQRRTQATSSASCVLVVTFEGRSYRPVHVGAATFTVAGPLGTGHFPPCNDTGGTPDTSPGEPVAVYRVQGLDPVDGIAYHANGDPNVPQVLLGALDLDRGWGTLRRGFQAFLDAHTMQDNSTIPPDTGAAALPRRSLTQDSPPQGAAPGFNGDVPTTTADRLGQTATPNPAAPLDPRCPATAEHTGPAGLPAPAEPLVDFGPTQVIVCRYGVSPTEPRHSSIIDNPAMVQRVTGALSALHSPGNTMQCTAEKGPDLALVAIGGAHKATIWVELYGCGIVTDGTNLFVGGKSLSWIAELQ